jgi:hypothetical protein
MCQVIPTEPHIGQVIHWRPAARPDDRVRQCPMFDVCCRPFLTSLYVPVLLPQACCASWTDQQAGTFTSRDFECGGHDAAQRIPVLKRAPG